MSSGSSPADLLPTEPAPAEPAATAAYLRTADASHELDLPPPAEPEEWDEVDELFNRPE